MKSHLTKSIKTTYLSKELDENEKLVEYLLNGDETVKLSDSEKERMERYFFCHDLISQKRSRHEVARKMQVKYKISRAQAYRDIYHMQYVIGSSLSIDENYYEKFLIDSIIETIRMSIKKLDLKAKAAAERNLAMVLGFPRPDDNRITPDMLQQNILIITSDVSALGLPKIANLEFKIKKYKQKAKKKQEFEEAEKV
jgi:hypothetical protein